MELYRELRGRLGLAPDPQLVDSLVACLVGARQLERIGGLGGEAFAAGPALAELEADLAGPLGWGPGQVQAREAAFAASLSEAWRGDEGHRGPGPGGGDSTASDRIFRERGWNEVDSGFRVFLP